MVSAGQMYYEFEDYQINSSLTFSFLKMMLLTRERSQIYE